MCHVVKRGKRRATWLKEERDVPRACIQGAGNRYAGVGGQRVRSGRVGAVGPGGTHQRQLRVEAQAHVDEDVRGVRHFRLAVHLRLEGCRV